MEVSEAISVPIDPPKQEDHDSGLGFHPSPSPSSNGDPDPPPADPDHGAEDDGEELHEKFGNLDLNEEEKEEEEEEVVKSDLEEKEDGVEKEVVDGGEIGNRDEIGSENGNGNGNENENENVNVSENGKGEESDGGEEGNRSENGNGSENDWEVNNDDEEEKKKDESESGSRKYQYPVRPEAEDCAFYLKTGSCKFGSNCKFNHPVRKKTNSASKEKVKENVDPADRPGQSECKYYLRSGGCKYGKACKYNHSRGRTSVAPVFELNFLGLPIRVGEKECPYYMRTGSCKYGSNCRFNHPDPTAAGGVENSPGFGNGGPSLQGPSQSTIPSWSAPRSLNETAPFVPMMLPPTQGIPSQNAEWNGYQAPVYMPDRNLPPPPPPAYVMNNPVTETNIYAHHPPPMQIDDYPERPGQPECSYFLKTGDCKFRSNCKYHHPKSRTSMAPPCALSDKGLPLRPDQNICTYYSRYGICKFGPACKYDHPVQSTSSAISGVDHKAYGHSSTMEGGGIARSGGRSESTIQQSV
ncbi:hypothetical protein UlMin_007793 [Ulmus minor]